ncbi:unnamed protein product, partial [marine sediment metagenome]
MTKLVNILNIFIFVLTPARKYIKKGIVNGHNKEVITEM